MSWMLFTPSPLLDIISVPCILRAMLEKSSESRLLDRYRWRSNSVTGLHQCHGSTWPQRLLHPSLLRKRVSPKMGWSFTRCIGFIKHYAMQGLYLKWDIGSSVGLRRSTICQNKQPRRIISYMVACLSTSFVYRYIKEQLSKLHDICPTPLITFY